MFNNCKHIRSRANYTRVAALDSANDIYYDGTRLIVGSSLNGTSTTQYANFISTVDSSYNVYKHTCGGTYSRAQQLVTIVNGTIFTESFVTGTTLRYGIHKWDSSYNWVSEYNGGSGYGNGIITTPTYLFAITKDRPSIVHSFDTTTTPLTTYIAAANTAGISVVARGQNYYTNRAYIQYYYTGTAKYRPGYYTIAGNTITALTEIVITEVPAEHWFGGAVCNNKALYVTNSGKAAVIDCATNTYTYLGTVIPSVTYRRGFSVVGNYIYLDTYYGGTQFHRFNTLDNTFETLTKLTSSNLYLFCAGFGGSTFASERDDITHQYYLIKIDM